VGEWLQDYLDILKGSFLFIYFFIIVVLGVHCGIYKSSYNTIAEFTPPSFSFIPPSPPFLE
jgi:hypothetical protein